MRIAASVDAYKVEWTRGEWYAVLEASLGEIDSGDGVLDGILDAVKCINGLSGRCSSQ